MAVTDVRQTVLWPYQMSDRRFLYFMARRHDILLVNCFHVA